jgi:hypothetical protein
MQLGKKGEILLQGRREIEGVFGIGLGVMLDFDSIHPKACMSLSLEDASEALGKLVSFNHDDRLTDDLGRYYLRAYREDNHPLDADFEAEQAAAEFAPLTKEDTDATIEEAFKTYDGWETLSHATPDFGGLEEYDEAPVLYSAVPEFYAASAA